MAISDPVFIIALGFALSYLVLYKTNKFLGDMGFIAISAAIIQTSTGTTTAIIGIMMLLGSIINIIADVITEWQNA